MSFIRLSNWIITADLNSLMPNLILQVKKFRPELDDYEAESLIRYINSFDPTGNEANYTSWIIKQIKEGKIDIERDKFDVFKTLRLYSLNKKKISENLYDLDWFTMKQKIEELSKKEELVEKSKKEKHLGEVLYDDGIYKVIKCDTVECATSTGQGTDWCTRFPEKAKKYLSHGPLYRLFKKGNPYVSVSYEDAIDVSDEAITKDIYFEIKDIFKSVGVDLTREKYVYESMSTEELNKSIEKGEYLSYLYEYQKLTPEQIDKAMEKGKNLDDLYRYQKLTPEQIDKAIEIGEGLDWLYMYHKLTPEQIDKAIEKGKNLGDLYRFQKLVPKQIDKAIEIGKNLDWLYMFQKLTPEQIDKAIEVGKDLSYLYEYQKLVPEQIDKAIEIGKNLDRLYRYHKLTPEQIDKAIEIGKNLDWLYMQHKLMPEQIDKAIEVGKDLSYLYEYQKLVPEQIDKAIEIGKDLDYLYRHYKLTPEQKERIESKMKKSSFLWKYAKEVKPKIPPELEPLAEEARKYKSAEEFVKKGRLPYLPPVREVVTSKEVYQVFDLGDKIRIDKSYKAYHPFGAGYISTTSVEKKFPAGQIKEANQWLDNYIKGEKIISDRNPFGYSSLIDFYNQVVKGIKEVEPKETRPIIIPEQEKEIESKVKKGSIRLSNWIITADLESKREQIKNWIIKRNPNITSEEADTIINEANSVDPTGSLGEYTWWIVKQLIHKNLIFPEDKDKVKESLSIFHKLKLAKTPGIEFNIDKYSKYGDLAEVIYKYKSGEIDVSKKELKRKELEEGVETVYQDKTYTVLKLTTKEAALKYSQGTEWCTRFPNYASSYIASGPLYLILKNGKRSWLISKEEAQIKDVFDKDIDIKGYKELRSILLNLGINIKKYEDLYKILVKGEIPEKILSYIVDSIFYYSLGIDLKKLIDDIYEYWNRESRYYSILDLPSMPDVEDLFDLEEMFSGQGRDIIYNANFPVDDETADEIAEMCGDEIDEIIMDLAYEYFDTILRRLNEIKKSFEKSMEEELEKIKDEIAVEEGYSSFKEVPENKQDEILEQAGMLIDENADFYYQNLDDDVRNPDLIGLEKIKKEIKSKKREYIMKRVKKIFSEELKEEEKESKVAMIIKSQLKPIDTHQDRDFTVAIDFDGVITDRGVSIEGEFGKITDGTRKALSKLKELGVKIIIFTAREDKDNVEKFLNENNIPYDEINENVDIDNLSEKVVADVYVDDRAFRFEGNWNRVIDFVLDKEKHKPWWTSFTKSRNGRYENVYFTEYFSV